MSKQAPNRSLLSSNSKSCWLLGLVAESYILLFFADFWSLAWVELESLLVHVFVKCEIHGTFGRLYKAMHESYRSFQKHGMWSKTH